MTIHFILLILAFILFLFAIDKNHISFIIFASEVLFFVTAFVLVTFRGETVGNDTIAYIDYFHLSGFYDSLIEFIQNTRFEPGYALLNYIISRFTDDYTVFFFIGNLISFSSTIYFFKNYCQNKYSWVILWFVWGGYYWSFSAVRASLALAFVYFFIDAILKNRIPRAILWLVVAGSFHYSALICSIVFLLRIPCFQKIVKNKIVLGITFLIIGIFLDKVMSLLPVAYSGYYFDSIYAEGSVRLASISDFTFLLILYFLTGNGDLNCSLWRYQREMRLLFLIGLGFSFLGLIFNQFNRVEMFFIPFAIVYIVNSFKSISCLRRVFVIVMVGTISIYQVVSFIIRPEWLGIFPYYFK